MAKVAGTQAAGIVQFLFDLQIDAKTSRKNIKTLVESLQDADKGIEKAGASFWSRTKQIESGAEKAIKGVSGFFGSLKNVFGVFMGSMPLLAAMKFESMVTRLGDSVDITGNKMGMFKSAISTMMMNGRGYTPDQINEAASAVSKWGTATYKATIDSSEAVLKLTRYTGMGAESAAEMYHQYVDIYKIYKNVNQASEQLGNSMVYAAMHYNLSGGEVVSALQTIEVTMMRLSATQKQAMMPGFVDSIGAMKSMGISASSSASILSNLGDITIQAGNNMKSAMLAYSGDTPTDLMSWFANPESYSDQIFTSLQKAIKNPALDELVKSAPSVAAGIFGLTPELFARLRNGEDFKTVLAEEEAKRVKDINLRKWEAEQSRKRQSTMDTVMQNLSNMLMVLGSKVGYPMLEQMKVMINRVINLSGVLLGIADWFAKSWNAISIFLVVGTLVIAALSLITNPAGWIAALVGIGRLVLPYILPLIIGAFITVGNKIYDVVSKIFSGKLDVKKMVGDMIGGAGNIIKNNPITAFIGKVGEKLHTLLTTVDLGASLKSMVLGFIGNMKTKFIDWVTGKKTEETKVSSAIDLKKISPITAKRMEAVASSNATESPETLDKETKSELSLIKVGKGQYAEIVNAIVHMERVLRDALSTNARVASYSSGGNY